MSRDTSAGARALWGRTAVVIAGVALIAAACGSDNSSSGSAATTAAAASATTAAAASATTAAASSATTAKASSATTAGSSATTAASSAGAKTVTDYAAYVGGSGAAKSDLKPIKIGYISQEGGPVEVGPTNDDGVDIAAKFINDQAGGIGGHPVQIVKCYIAATEEEGQQCGQKMANDKD